MDAKMNSLNFGTRFDADFNRTSNYASVLNHLRRLEQLTYEGDWKTYEDWLQFARLSITKGYQSDTFELALLIFKQDNQAFVYQGDSLSDTKIDWAEAFHAFLLKAERNV